MADPREQIMARLETICGTISGVTTVTRNEIEFDDNQLPALSVIEGDEDASDAIDGRGRPSHGPNKVTMQPQIFIRAAEGAGNNIGTLLNELRAAVIKAVLEDAKLQPNAGTLIGTNGSVRYAGAQSTLHAGRSMLGSTALMFAITYILRPSDL